MDGRRNPAESLLDAATRILDEEGREAVTARRLGREIGASSMAVYTHFGSMDELLAGIWRRGFARFGDALASATTTADPVADWMVQGWAYRRFALENRHLYRVMFSDGLVSFSEGHPEDRVAAQATFGSLLDRIRRCVEDGRWQVEDLFLAGQLVWATSHGHCSIELTGYFESMQLDPRTAFGACLSGLSVGFGDDRDAARRSVDAARRRARRLRIPPVGAAPG